MTRLALAGLCAVLGVKSWVVEHPTLPSPPERPVAAPPFNPESYLADCTAIANDWVVLNQIQQELKRP